MNNYYILGFAAVVILVLILFTTGEFKGAVIVPDYHGPYIPTQEGSSRGGNMMYTYRDLGVPLWKWNDCCSG